jgi:hypothetical protein
MAREEEGFFDELARGLADGTLTRGKALRLMGAALVGGTLASLGIGEAGADPPGCKRAGKNCTRDTQCCGNLVCPSGTCQTPTTTTTKTPTTTTTETPTTTTTTMCIPNGGTCSASIPCCSGNCFPGNNTCQPPMLSLCECDGGGQEMCVEDCASTFDALEAECMAFCASRGVGFLDYSCDVIGCTDF